MMEPFHIANFANFILLCCYVVWQYLQKRGDKTNERLDELTKRSETIEKDLAKRSETIEKDMILLQSGIRGSLRHDDLARVYDAINKLSEQVNHMEGEFKSQSQMLRLIINRITEKGMP